MIMQMNMQPTCLEPNGDTKFTLLVNHMDHKAQHKPPPPPPPPPQPLSSHYTHTQPKSVTYLTDHTGFCFFSCRIFDLTPVAVQLFPECVVVDGGGVDGGG